MESKVSPRGVPPLVHAVANDKAAAVPIDEDGVVGLGLRL